MIDGRFEVVSTLGQGGMGAVLRARDLSRGGVEVAVKVLLPGLADEALLERFVREAETAARVDRGEGLARVHATGRSGATWWIAQELVVGRDLADWLRERPRAQAEVARLLAAVARTLGRCHAAGVVHRDVKPQNIVVRAEDDAPVLVDFGVAHDGAASRRLTQTGELIGTPGFMAPEQVDGRGVDGRTDVHALGCVLFFALTGRAPFEGPLAQALAAVVSREVSWPDSPLAAAGRRAMAKDPAARHPTAEALAQDLLGAPAGPGRPRALALTALVLAALGVAALVARRGRDGPTAAATGDAPRELPPAVRRALGEFARGVGDLEELRATLASAELVALDRDVLLDVALAQRLAARRTGPEVVAAVVSERARVAPELETALVAWVASAQTSALDDAVTGRGEPSTHVGQLVTRLTALDPPARAAKVAWLELATPDRARRWLAEAKDEVDARARCSALEARLRDAPRAPADETAFLTRVRDDLAARRPLGELRVPDGADLAALALDARVALAGGPPSKRVGDLLRALRDDVEVGQVEVALAQLRHGRRERLLIISQLAENLDPAVGEALRSDRPGSAAVALMNAQRSIELARKSGDRSPDFAAWASASRDLRAVVDAPGRDLAPSIAALAFSDGARALGQWARAEAQHHLARPRPAEVALAGRLLARALEAAGEDRLPSEAQLAFGELGHLTALRAWGRPQELAAAVRDLEGRWAPTSAAWIDGHLELGLRMDSSTPEVWGLVARGLEGSISATGGAPGVTRLRIALARARLHLGDVAGAEAALVGVGPLETDVGETIALLGATLGPGRGRLALRFRQLVHPHPAPPGDGAMRRLFDEIDAAAAAEAAAR